MATIDAALLNLVERACRWFQRMTGRTNVWLAFQLTNLSVIVYFVWVATLYWVSSSLSVRTFVAVFCGGIAWVLSRTIFRTPVEQAEKLAYARVAKGLRNPRRLRDMQLRISFLSLSIVLPSIIFSLARTLGSVRTEVNSRSLMSGEALIVLTTIVLYLLACDPLPPAAAKAPAWLRALIPARAEGAAETAQRSKAA